MKTQNFGNPKFRALCAQIKRAMRRYLVPGVAVGIYDKGKEYFAGFGVTNVEHPQAVDADTLFQIGSTTKTFTATAVMRLVEMGKIELDAPVRKYLPHFRLNDTDAAMRATMRHLLTHMGGWLGDYFDDTGDGDDAVAKFVASMIELPQLTPLRTIWSYNNAGFAVAGRIIEVVTGKSYESAMQELVFDPLGLKTTFLFPKDVMTRRFAVGHQVVNDKATVARPWPIARSGNPVGGIASTVKDQIRYARFCMGDGKPLLSRDSMQLMQSSQVSAALGEKMGLAWFINEIAGVRIIRHGGATLGQLSAFLFAPKRGFAITVLTNANRGAELNREITAWALEKYLGVKEPKPKLKRMSKPQLTPYLGRYTSALADNELLWRNGELILKTIPKGGFPTKDSPPPPAPPPSRLAFINPDRVIALDGQMKNLQGEFLRNPDGSIAWFRFGSRIRARER